MIYLDYAAATPLDTDVHDAMVPYFFDSFFNPSSPYAPAVYARRDLESARHRLAVCIGAQTDEIILTAGATESIALAFTAAHGGHVVTTAIEHAAVIENARQYDATIVDVLPSGRVDPAAIRAAITDETQLVSVGLANSELGTVQPLKQIEEIVQAERLRRASNGNNRPIWLHSDASQGAGMLDIHVSRLGVDMVTLNAAKVYGPKQTGLLWRRAAVQLSPIVHGGGQEQGLRGGTESVANAVGFAVALEKAERMRKSENVRIATLRDRLQKRITDACADVVVSGDQKRRLAGHLHISFPGCDAERILFMLEDKSVYVATGSACAANKGTRSHVLEAIGLEPAVADGSIRITLGRDTTDEIIDSAAKEIIAAVQHEQQRRSGS